MKRESQPPECLVDRSPGIVVIRNVNTTIGYCRFTPSGDIEYIFVNPMYRRLGYGRRLLDEVRSAAGRLGDPLEPVSPLGRRFFAASAASRSEAGRSPPCLHTPNSPNPGAHP